VVTFLGVHCAAATDRAIIEKTISFLFIKWLVSGDKNIGLLSDYCHDIDYIKKPERFVIFTT
jgi:hypothetical protein